MGVKKDKRNKKNNDLHIEKKKLPNSACTLFYTSEYTNKKINFHININE